MAARSTVVASVVLVSLLAFGVAAAPAAEPVNCSLVALLSNPERYQGTIVRVSGVAKLAGEVTSLYLTREHAAAGIIENAVWLDLRGYTGKIEGLSGRYIVVESFFDTGVKGHLGAWGSGTRTSSAFQSWKRSANDFASRGSERFERGGSVVADRVARDL